MGIWKAEHTLAAIDNAIAADGGNTFRGLQGQVLPHIHDAYRSDEDSYRSHLGASVIGGKCERAIYYGHRWALKRPPRGKKGEPKTAAHARMVRLWNRGHLEEGRFIAMLLMIGVQVFQQDDSGKQYRISNLGGHFAGSGDGILLGVPDLPPGVPCLGEYKTHSAKSFDTLKEEGVKEAKPEHYAQMQQYMMHFGLLYALYVAVCKDTDELWAEIVMYDHANAQWHLDRAARILWNPEPPARIRGASPGYHQCKYLCDFPDVCYGTVKPDVNCRTCDHVSFQQDGTVGCLLRMIFPSSANERLTKEQQMAGCSSYRVNSKL